jgi:hypothetical protein
MLAVTDLNAETRSLRRCAAGHRKRRQRSERKTGASRA